jgi:hypothetical protein
MSKELGIKSIVWDPEKQIYVTNPKLIEHEEKIIAKRKKGNQVEIKTS